MARIMVVEDDVYMREELTDLLRKSGYETASLFDFENAIPEITEYSPDLVLPGWLIQIILSIMLH